MDNVHFNITFVFADTRNCEGKFRIQLLTVFKGNINSIIILN